MSTTLLKKVKITKQTISFEYVDSNVFPRRFHYEEMENNSENWQMMKHYLKGRIWVPIRHSPRLYKLFGITQFYDGMPVK